MAFSQNNMNFIRTLNKVNIFGTFLVFIYSNEKQQTCSDELKTLLIKIEFYLDFWTFIPDGQDC